MEIDDVEMFVENAVAAARREGVIEGLRQGRRIFQGYYRDIGARLTVEVTEHFDAEIERLRAEQKEG